MKTLYLMRHGKSSWKDITLKDFDRPLNKRGKRDIPFMGKLLYKKGVVPDSIYSSPAKRASDTAIGITSKLEFNKDIEFNEKIYESNLYTLESLIRSFDDRDEIVFLFGHNPTFNIFVEDYCDFYENIPTCGFVQLQFNCEKWEDIGEENCRLVEFEYPKKYIKN